MITVISDNHEIIKLHKQFHKQLDQHLTKKIRCWVGYQGGSDEVITKYYRGLNLWVMTQELNNRYNNGFGIGEPVENRNHSLVCEINFPYDGINRRIAGAFAQSDNGRILILHRGNIAGGRMGIGKNAFVENLHSDPIRATDGDREADFCFVGELGSPLLHEQLRDFIREVSRIKGLINNGKKS